MQTKPRTPQAPKIVNYQFRDEIDNSEHQLKWSEIMDRGNYQKPSTYEKVEALLLCWQDDSNDMSTKGEVKRLKAVFEKKFKYNTQIEYLDNSLETKLQVHVNATVAAFVKAHDGPNTLLIVYYAGHGRPGSYFGSLELFGKCSPNDTEKHGSETKKQLGHTKKQRDDKKKQHLDDRRKRVNSIVWNQTEDLLKPAEADVLELFDCCYAGNLGLTRGQPRLFEYLAATKEMASTPVPGKDSFTSALIYALEALVEEQQGGRFTTVELLNKIKEDAPHFPKNQTPVLSDREEKTSAGRIMLHPLRGGDTKARTTRQTTRQTSQIDISNQDTAIGHTLTLHFDFGDKPPNIHIERLGLGLNNLFERNTLGVNRIRWGGLHSIIARAARNWMATLERGRTKRQRSYINASGSEGCASPGLLEPPPTPAYTTRSYTTRSSAAASPTNQYSPRKRGSVAMGELEVDLSGFNVSSFSIASMTKAEPREQSRDRRKKLKLSV